MGNGGILGILSGIVLVTSTTRQLLGRVDPILVGKIVAKSVELAKKHGVSVIGDLSKGNVEAAISEASSWLADELKEVVTDNPIKPTES